MAKSDNILTLFYEIQKLGSILRYKKRINIPNIFSMVKNVSNVFTEIWTVFDQAGKSFVFTSIYSFLSSFYEARSGEPRFDCVVLLIK